MIKQALTLFFAFVISSSVLGWGSPKPTVKTPQAPKVEVSDPGHISILLSVKGTTAQVARITRLKDVAQKIINSEKFKERVLGAYYDGKPQFQGTLLSNSQVYEQLRQGNELGSGIDYIWNMEVRIEKARCSTLGWTNPSIKHFYFNSCGFDSRTDSGVTGTLCHEWIHKVGFGHDSSRTSRRQYSVPYAVGTICAELYKEFI